MNEIMLLDKMDELKIDYGITELFDKELIEDKLELLSEYSGYFGIQKQILFNEDFGKLIDSFDYGKVNKLFRNFQTETMIKDAELLQTVLDQTERVSEALIKTIPENFEKIITLYDELGYWDFVEVMKKLDTFLNKDWIGRYRWDEDFVAMTKQDVEFADDTGGEFRVIFRDEFRKVLEEFGCYDESVCTLINLGVPFEEAKEFAGSEAPTKDYFGYEVEGCKENWFGELDRLILEAGVTKYRDQIIDEEGYVSRLAYVLNKEFIRKCNLDEFDELPDELFEECELNLSKMRPLNNKSEILDFFDLRGGAQWMFSQGFSLEYCKEINKNYCNVNDWRLLAFNLTKRPLEDWSLKYQVSDEEVYNIISYNYYWTEDSIKYRDVIIRNHVTRPLDDGGAFDLLRKMLMIVENENPDTVDIERIMELCDESDLISKLRMSSYSCSWIEKGALCSRLMHYVKGEEYHYPARFLIGLDKDWECLSFVDALKWAVKLTKSDGSKLVEVFLNLLDEIYFQCGESLFTYRCLRTGEVIAVKIYGDDSDYEEHGFRLLRDGWIPGITGAPVQIDLLDPDLGRKFW